MSSGGAKRPVALWVLMGVLAFQGLSATPPGLLLVLEPTGGLMKMPVTMLQESPFRDFLIPGLILCLVLGLGAWLVAAGLFFRRAWSWAAAIGFGLALMIWILVQIAMIGCGSWLQPFYFGVGLTILLAALMRSVREHLSQR